ncbi:MAG: thiamine phosphate synthase [Novosphingobium sp.]|nr:thiamine phosphate synthase [Novosphingobium sp.]
MKSRQTQKRHPLLPRLWLIGDARNDAALEQALLHLPRGSGFIFRHYHLSPARRRARFGQLARIARRRGHVVALSGNVRQARAWGADGAYGAPRRLGRAAGVLRLATAHTLAGLGAANRAGADAILLSPVFATRSHPGAKTLGPLRFRLLSSRAQAPVIALGGMNPRTADRLRWPRWAAIDGLS